MTTNSFVSYSYLKSRPILLILHSFLRYPQVLEELHQDYLTRKAYLSYLVRAHQGLVGTRQFLEKALERVDRSVVD